MPGPMTSAASAEVRALFEDLLELPLLSPGKPSLAENLLDILEVCAVAAGLKTCHLQGDGFRDPDHLALLEATAGRHGLLTRRTPRCQPAQPGPSRLAPTLHSRLQALGDARRAAAPEVLWIYREPAVAARIDAAVTGGTDLGDLLDYPACCANRHAALAQRWLEAYVEALQGQHQTTDPDALARLLAQDTPVDPALLPLPSPQDASGHLLPYVSFDACPACQTDPDSLASRAQAPLRALAFALSRPFALRLWQAQLEEAGAPPPQAHTACPCGSGQDHGQCCNPMSGPGQLSVYRDAA